MRDDTYDAIRFDLDCAWDRAVMVASPPLSATERELLFRLKEPMVRACASASTEAITTEVQAEVRDATDASYGDALRHMRASLDQLARDRA
jgi:hypothetical protein